MSALSFFLSPSLSLSLCMSPLHCPLTSEIASRHRMYTACYYAWEDHKRRAAGLFSCSEQCWLTDVPFAAGICVIITLALFLGRNPPPLTFFVAAMTKGRGELAPAAKRSAIVTSWQLKEDIRRRKGRQCKSASK